MDFALAPEDEAFRDELRGWLEVNLPKFLADWGGDEDPGGGRVTGGVERTQERRKDWQRRLNEGRWAAINWPEVLTVTAPLICWLVFVRVTLSLTPLLLELPPMTSGPGTATPAVLERSSGPSRTVVAPVNVFAAPPL